jgi:hypothetical protein
MLGSYQTLETVPCGIERLDLEDPRSLVLLLQKSVKTALDAEIQTRLAVIDPGKLFFGGNDFTVFFLKFRKDLLVKPGSLDAADRLIGPAGKVACAGYVL